ncbi:MAG: GNAT family N-acetyltransferase [Bacteroidetes bacterium]|nr:GNAT family N-acetyltransferase [Bacteroidota bacterium]
MKWNLKKFDELSIHELYAILQIRMQVFVLEQRCFYLDVDDVDKESLHLFATNSDGEIQAYARLIPAGVVYPVPSFGRVLTRENMRGTGLGKLLVEKAIQTMEQEFGTSAIKISAQSQLEKFYNVYGFSTCGPEYLDAEMPHLPMMRN